MELNPEKLLIFADSTVLNGQLLSSVLFCTIMLLQEYTKPILERREFTKA
jgi:hypothetical protein